MTRFQYFFYPFAKAILRVFCFWPYSGCVIGAENVPKDGAFLLTPSHRSMLDIPWVSMCTSRRVRFMGKASAFSMPIVGSLFKLLGGFPVARDGSDRGPLRDSLKILAAGEPLAVFPEGTRQRGDKIGELQQGAAYLAIKSQVPVVPIALYDTERTWRGQSKFPSLGGPGIVLVGKALVPPVTQSSVVKREVVEAFTAQLHEEMQSLWDQAKAIAAK